MLVESVTLEDLVGTWYINMTNFPMWLKGDKTSPTLNYKISERNGVKGLEDEVKYTDNGKQKSIKGFDKPLNDQLTSYIWRGNGLLWLLSSKWDLLYLDQEKQIAITHFEKTIFTPEGIDVISKKKKLSEEDIKDIMGIIEKNKFPLKSKLEVIRQD